MMMMMTTIIVRTKFLWGREGWGGGWVRIGWLAGWLAGWLTWTGLGIDTLAFLEDEM